MNLPSIRYLEGDLFDKIKEVSGTIFLPHVCNDKNAFGAGFVVPLAKNFPMAKTEYHNWAEGRYRDKPFSLGETQYVPAAASQERSVVVCNMIAQGLGGRRPLRYNALASCMDSVAATMKRHRANQIYAPFFGSDLAGGSWAFIGELIEDCWLQQNIQVTICYLPGRYPQGWTPL